MVVKVINSYEESVVSALHIFNSVNSSYYNEDQDIQNRNTLLYGHQVIEMYLKYLVDGNISVSNKNLHNHNIQNLYNDVHLLLPNKINTLLSKILKSLNNINTGKIYTSLKYPNVLKGTISVKYNDICDIVKEIEFLSFVKDSIISTSSPDELDDILDDIKSTV